MQVPSAYSSWKGWDSKSFGTLSRYDRIYFRHQLRVCGIGPIKRVLEIGFGNGAFLEYCRQCGYEATGSEILPDQIQRARQAGYNAIAPQEVASLADDQLDLIVALDVLEHIPSEEVIPLLALWRQKLRPGGAILLRYPNGDSPISLPNQNADVTHVNAIGSRKLMYYAANASLKVAYIGPQAQPILCGDWRYGLHRLLSAPFKAIVELFMRAVFFPMTPVHYCQANVCAVLVR